MGSDTSTSVPPRPGGRLAAFASGASWVWVVAACAVPIGTVVYVVAAYSPAQILDQWEEVLWLRRYYAGAARVADLWRLHNEHSLFFPRLFFVTDLLVFHGTNVLLVPANLAIQAVTCFVYAAVAWSAKELSRPVARYLIGVSLMVLLSAVQIENFAWGFQVPFVMVFCAAVVGIFGLARHGATARDRTWSRWVGLGCGGGVVATFSMANGILTWPILLGVAVVSRLRARTVGLVLGAGAVTVALRLAVGIPGADLTPAFAQPARVLTFFCWYLGTPFRHVSVYTVHRMGLFGACTAAALPLYYLARRRALTPFQTVHLGSIGFVVASGLVTSIGRQHWPLDILLNTRFATPALLFWSSLASLLVYELRGAAPAARAAQGLAIAAVGAVLLGYLVPAHLVAGPAQRGYSRAVEYATLALVVGVEDQTSLNELHTRPEELLPLVPFLREHRIGLFARDWTTYLNRPVADIYRIGPGFYPARPEGSAVAGALDHVRPLPVPPGRTAPPDGAIVEGWAWDLAGRRPVELVLLVNDAGVVRGLALPDVPRPEITTRYAADLPGSLERPGWFGFVASRGDFPVRAFAVTQGSDTAYPLAIRLAAPGSR